MNKKQIAITLGIMCFILTIALCVQIKTMNEAGSTASRTLVDNELRDQVLRWKEKYDNTYYTLKESEKRLEEIRIKATKDNTSAKSKEEELKKNMMILGLTDVKGDGIIVELKDGSVSNNDSLFPFENPSNVIVHYNDLLAMVNELNNSGAEAIEINGQRIVNTSAITCEGTVIKINGEKIGSPFVIKAIGSQGLLYGSITRAGSYIDVLKEDGVETSVTKEDNIHIEKYKGVINFKYVKAMADR